MMKSTHCLFLLLTLAISLEAAEQTVNPLSSPKCEFVPGQVGRALQMTTSLKLQYPESVFSLPGGTIEIWVKPDEKIPQGKQVFLIGNGTNNPAWFFWGFDNANTNFLCRSKKDAKSFHYYSSIRIPFETPEKTWTHFALVWCNAGPGESLVQLFVNGKVLIERFDQTLASASAGPVAIGFNTAGSAQPSFAGAVDELRISNVPRGAAEIQADYQAGLNGKPLAADDKTLLYVNFDDSLQGKSNAAVLPLEKLKAIGNDLLDKLTGE